LGRLERRWRPVVIVVMPERGLWRIGQAAQRSDGPA
jgi:hypothetical protein